MSPSSTVHGGQHDIRHVTFELLLHAAFVADKIWGFTVYSSTASARTAGPGTRKTQAVVWYNCCLYYTSHRKMQHLIQVYFLSLGTHVVRCVRCWSFFNTSLPYCTIGPFKSQVIYTKYSTKKVVQGASSRPSEPRPKYRDQTRRQPGNRQQPIVNRNSTQRDEFFLHDQLTITS